MRKLLISLIMVAALGATSAFAQSGYWAGVSAGYPGAKLHFGVENVFAGLDLRGNLGFGYIGSSLELGVSVLYGLELDTGMVPLDVYAGGGPTLGVTLGDDGGFLSALEAFAGAEYRLGDLGLEQGGVFLELGPRIQFTPDFKFVPVGRLGFNWHF